MSYTGSGIEENALSGSILSLRQHSLQRGANHDRNDIMALTRLLVGLWASAQAFLGPVPAPRRAAPLHIIETESGTDEKEIFSETTSISGALAELWQVLANPPPPGDFRAMYFPQCEGLKRPQTFQALFEHLEVCKDLCGINQCWPGLRDDSARTRRKILISTQARTRRRTLEPTSTRCQVLLTASS